MIHPLPSSDLDEVLEASRSSLSELRSARILLTGATGFLGKWLLETFSAANRELSLHAELTALSRDPETFCERAPHLAREKSITWLRGDVRALEKLPGKFTHIIHAATPVGGQYENQETYETTVEGTKRILSLAGRPEIGSPKLLYLSSGAVYGELPPGVESASEDSAQEGGRNLAPFSYGLAKKEAERLCHASSTPTVIARCFAFLGPHIPLDQTFAAGAFIASALQKETLVVRGDGTAVRSYMYPSDLMSWLWTLLIQGKPGRTYNVGSEEAVTIRQLAARIAGQQNLGFEVLGMTVEGRSASRYLPNTSRVRSELGLMCSVSLDEACRRTLDWYERNR